MASYFMGNSQARDAAARRLIGDILERVSVMPTSGGVQGAASSVDLAVGEIHAEMEGTPRTRASPSDSSTGWFAGHSERLWSLWIVV